MKTRVDQLLHGYQFGHQLLAGSIKLDAQTAELIAQLSDLSGSISSESNVQPYLTCYPLFEQNRFAIAKTWLDTDAPRAGCVLTHTLLIPMEVWTTCGSPI